ncbi:MAG TPA: efflux RND transporter periplasmic adaptor subunit [Fimbriimonas sp.]|nr:efflux RND transporter periplasmic adaptor subunit [Fimbriimonas sp.]
MKRILIISVIVIALLALVGWRIVTKTTANAAMQKQGAAQRKQPTVVTLATAGPKDVANSIQAVGTIESPFQVKLSPNISGRIDYLEVREGDQVQAGQVLVRINPDYVEGQILQAQSNVAAAQQRLAQARITQSATAVGINSTVEQNKAAVASAEADYNETVTNSQRTVGTAHEAYVDAEAKVASAQSAVQSAEAEVELAQANLEDASAKYTREYSLYKQGFIAPQDLDDAKAAEKVDKATVNARQKDADAATSALRSAQAQARAAKQQENIVRKQQDSAILDSRSKLTQAKKVLLTAVANRSQIPAYEENLKALRSEVDAAQAALNQAIAQRSYLILKSPITGTVTQRLFDPGATATAGSPVLVVQSLDKLFMTSAVPVEDTPYIHTGMDTTMTVDGVDNQVFHAKISDINKSADPSSRQFMIRTSLDNRNGIFRPGMYCRITIVTSYVHAAVTVPREAVKTDESNHSSVTVVGDDMVAHVTPVVLGAQDATTVEIKSGIKAGDKVVNLSYRPVADNSKVKVGSWDVQGQGGGGRRGRGQGGPGAQSGTTASTTTGGGAPSAAPGSEGGGGGGGAMNPGGGQQFSAPGSTNGTPQGGVNGQVGPSGANNVNGSTGGRVGFPSGPGATGAAGTNPGPTGSVGRGGTPGPTISGGAGGRGGTTGMTGGLGAPGTSGGRGGAIGTTGAAGTTGSGGRGGVAGTTAGGGRGGTGGGH